MKIYSRGLSLVEMAIGLAIVGMLLAMTLAGTQLMAAAELRSMSSQVQSFQVAIDNFRDNYGFLPGDYDNATSVWGTYNAVSAPDGTTNGDGDGQIEYPTSSEAESLRAWQQLSLSSYLKGSYSGVAVGANNQADIGINVPSSKRKAVGFYLFYGDLATVETRNEIRLGAFRSSSANSNAALTPKDAKNIDLKTDDGNPTAGNIYAIKGTDIVSETCQSGGSDYNITLSSKACILSFALTPQ